MDQLWSDDDEVGMIVVGENVKVKVKGIEEEDVSPGFVLCDANNPIRTGRVFDAQLVILEHKSIICAGYSAVMHIHCAAEEVTVRVRKSTLIYPVYDKMIMTSQLIDTIFSYKTVSLCVLLFQIAIIEI